MAIDIGTSPSWTSLAGRGRDSWPAALRAPLLLLALGCGGSSTDAAPMAGSSTTTLGGEDGSSTDTTGGADDGSSTSGVEDTTTSDPSDQALERVLEYMGGAATLANLGAFEVSGQGSRFIPGEGYLPEDAAIPANQFTWQTSYDLDGQRLHIEIDRTVLLFGLDVPQAFAEIVDGTVGAIAGSESLFGIPGGAMISDRWASVLRQQYLLHPHVLLREVAGDTGLAAVGEPQRIDGTLYDVIEVADPVAPLRLFADSATGEPYQLRTVESDPLHRDVELVVTYTDWQRTAEPVPFPGHVTISRADELLHDEQRTELILDPKFSSGLFELPGEVEPEYDEAAAERGRASHQFHQVFASIGLPSDGLQTTVMPLEVAPGVWHLRGGTHHSLLVEQQDGLVLVEAPLNPERSNAILQWTDDAFPGLPVTHMVISHFHDDHGAGAREVVAGGATLVVGTAAEEFWQQVLAAPSAIIPDALWTTPVEVPMETVPMNLSLTLDDPIRPVVLYPVDNSHAVDLVMAVVDGVIYIADIYSPGNPPFIADGASDLYQAILSYGLEGSITAIVGAHGYEIHTLDQLAAMAGA